MDKWNQDQNREYSGVNAQRRNRRRLSPSDRPAEPETAAAEDTPILTDEPAEPVIPAAAVRPAAPADPAVPDGTAGTEEAGKPTGSEEPETPPEPAVQGADSRVPPEARRMAAAPYGVPREGAKRPGTRPQVAPKRPPVPEQNRPAPRPRREAPMAGTSPVSGTGAARANAGLRERSPRVNVGYAPGRMSEDGPRSVPAADSVRESLYGRDAKAYLEKRKSPFHIEEEKKPLPNKPAHKKLRAAVAVLVAAGLILSGWMLLKGLKGGKEKGERDIPQIIHFELTEPENKTAPVELTFSAETGKDVQEVRLCGEDDRNLVTDAISGNNTESTIWTMKMPVDDAGYNGTVRLQVRRTGSGEDDWIDTGLTAEVNISPRPGAEIQSGPTAVPYDEDYYDPDAEDTPLPDPKAAQAASLTPEATEQATPTPTPTATQEEVTPGVLLTPEPTPTPAPTEVVVTPTPPLTAEAAPEANPELISSTTVYSSFTKKEKEYSRPAKDVVKMPAGDEYSKQKLGVLTFRGDNFRRNAATGTLSAAPLKLAVLWQAEAGSARGEKQTYYGYQWTGQPVIARWSAEVRTKSNITESKIEKSGLKEVIIAGVDGAIRFLDLEDGKITRNSIKLGYAMKGTPSLDPRGYPFMSVGQFARKMKNKRGQIGLREYNLYSQKEIKLIDGLDGKYHRPLNDIGSFETSALIDRESDTLIAVGTNGMLYLQTLGSNFDFNLGVLTISPSVVAMNSRAKGQKSNALLAVESSPAAYSCYVYYADMGGVLRCVDTNSLRAVWAVNTGDSVMAAIALDLTEDRELNLYTANMFNNRKKGNGSVQIRRYDALSGREIWCTDVGVYKGKKDNTKDNVGAKASPVIGQNGLSDYVYFTVTGLSDEGREQLGLAADTPAALIALNKNDGKKAWAFGLGSRSESSPVALYDKEGNGWIVQCEQDGTIHLVDGLTGREISSLKIEGEIEASPAAYNNVVVVGTTGKGKAFVYGIEVKLDKPEATPVPESAEGQQGAEAGDGQEAGSNEEAANDGENGAGEESGSGEEPGYGEEAGYGEEPGSGEEGEYGDFGEQDAYEEYEDFDPYAEEEGGDGY